MMHKTEESGACRQKGGEHQHKVDLVLAAKQQLDMGLMILAFKYPPGVRMSCYV
jgi:hypothetical protein